MITSFSRLFRQIFGGPRTQPETGAATRAVGADVEAREAAAHRENLKRAMEVAFATPTAGPEEPLVLTTPLEEQVAALEVAVTAEPDEAEEPVLELVEVVEPPTVEPATAGVEQDDTVALLAMHTAEVAAAPSEEILPALDLAEVEDIGSDQAPVENAATAEVAAETTSEIIEADAETEAVEPPAEVSEEAHEPEAEPVALADADVELDAVSEAVTETPVEEVAEPVAEELEPAAETSVGEEPAEHAAAAPKAKRTKKAAAKPKPKKKAAPAKRKTAKKAGSLEDGAWLSDAIVYSLRGEWTSTWTPPEDASAAERLELFREKAAAGEFVIWGCAEGKDAWEPIKPAYWKTALVEPLSFLMGRENVATDPKASKAKNPVKYTALKVVQPDIEALWPPSTQTGAVRDAA
jgi:hypothetical protein